MVQTTKVSERTKAENVEDLIVSLAKKGVHSAKIGLILREKYDISKIKHLGKKVTEILKENKIEYESDLDFVNKKINRVEEHYNKNKQDKRAKREIVRYIGLRRKLQKYNAKKEK